MSVFATLLLVLVALSACDKEPRTLADPTELRFSLDTVNFDSVFVGRTSPTMTLSIYNPAREEVRIPRISLQAGGASPYVALVDGLPGPVVEDVRLAPHDSILVFLRFRNELATSDTISRCNDALVVRGGGREHTIPLVAWTVNVQPFDMLDIRTDVVLDGDAGPRARLATGSVTVHPGASLRLTNGAQLYFPRECGLEVKGKLVLEGTRQHPVVLGADRIDRYYRRALGLWNGVHLHPGSEGNVLRYAEIRNAVTALRVEEAKGASGVELKLQWCKLLYYGLDALHLERSQAMLYGCLIAQGARNGLRLRSARAELEQTTVYSVLPELQLRQGPLVRLEEGEGNMLLVRNSILWGDREEEVVLTQADSESGRVLFTHSILPFSDGDMRLGIVGEGCSNQAPDLENPLEGDFRPKAQSPAVGLGGVIAPLDGKDMLGRPFGSVGAERPVAGAYACVECPY
ncbi:MAG: hypothetical protein CSA07_02630 [Bacteroidia bacterium]|nr:MAG: hypothetical protein CSA07_02630 [Bacteroidia bacterium]